MKRAVIMVIALAIATSAAAQEDTQPDEQTKYMMLRCAFHLNQGNYLDMSKMSMDELQNCLEPVMPYGPPAPPPPKKFLERDLTPPPSKADGVCKKGKIWHGRTWNCRR